METNNNSLLWKRKEAGEENAQRFTDDGMAENVIMSYNAVMSCTFSVLHSSILRMLRGEAKGRPIPFGLLTQDKYLQLLTK